MSDRAPLRPSRLLAELAAGLACVILLVFIGSALVDWIRHLRGDEEYRQAQRDRHSFLCQVHAADLPDDPDPEDVPMHQVLRLLDAARTEVVAPHLLAKIQHFYICATVTKIGVGGTELRSAGIERVRILSGDVGERAKVQRYVEAIADLFPAFPADIRDEIARHIRDMTLAEAYLATSADIIVPPEPFPEPVFQMPSVPEEPSVVQRPGDDGVTEAPVVVEAPPETWLMIVGADKSEAAALDQIDAIARLVEEQLALGADGTELRLYRRSGWLRSALVFDSPEAAEGAFATLIPHLKYGAILRAEEVFCAETRDADPLRDVPVVDCVT